jgi:hypothetical protein
VRIYRDFGEVLAVSEDRAALGTRPEARAGVGVSRLGSAARGRPAGGYSAHLAGGRRELWCLRDLDLDERLERLGIGR